MDSLGNVVAGGLSDAAWSCVPECTTEDYAGWADAFVASLDSTGALQWNTFLGAASEDDYLNDLALDSADHIYATGVSWTSWGEPLRLFSTGGVDAYVARVDTDGSLAWNTFLGSSDFDYGLGAAFDSADQLYIAGSSMAGWSCSPTPCTLRPYSQDRDGFVVTMDTDGDIAWNSFIGGFGSVGAFSVATDASGNTYVAGDSVSVWGLPIRASWGDYDAFVAKLDPSGALIWNTFLGGNLYDDNYALALDGSGNIYVTGESDSSWGTPFSAFGGGDCDAYVAKLAPDGTLLWNTFLGGTDCDYGTALEAAGNGHVFVGGRSAATWGSPKAAFHGGTTDAFVAELDEDGALLWNTFVGGGALDSVREIALGPGPEIFVAGYSQATWGSPKNPFDGTRDGFAAKLEADGDVVWNTFLGVSTYDALRGLDLDADGNVFIGGYSYGTGSDTVFAAQLDSGGNLNWIAPVGTGTSPGGRLAVDQYGSPYIIGDSSTDWGSPIRGYSAGTDGFAAKLTPAGGVVWNTFLGGSDWDSPEDLAIDTSGKVHVAGWSWATWGTPVHPFSEVGNTDGFVALVNITIPTTVSISGNAGAAGAALSYDDGGPQTATADGSGDYSIMVPYNWSGTVTPSLADYSFSPPSRTYTDLAIDTTGQNYDATIDFSDVPVPGKEWMEPWVVAFYNEGITTGCGASPLRYCPENPVTRAAMAVFVLRAIEGPSYVPPPASHYFCGCAGSGKEWMEPWVDEFYAEASPGGCAASPLRYCPENPVTRAAMAVFLLKALEGSSYVPPIATHTFADVPVAGKEWMEPWVDEFYTRGITTGCGASPLIYCPENPVTRAAMAVFIDRAYSLYP